MPELIPLELITLSDNPNTATTAMRQHPLHLVANDTPTPDPQRRIDYHINADDSDNDYHTTPALAQDQDHTGMPELEHWPDPTPGPRPMPGGYATDNGNAADSDGDDGDMPELRSPSSSSADSRDGAPSSDDASYSSSDDGPELQPPPDSGGEDGRLAAVHARNHTDIAADLAHYRTVIATLENGASTDTAVTDRDVDRLIDGILGPRRTRTAGCPGIPAPGRGIFAPCIATARANPSSWTVGLTTPTTVDVSAPYLRSYHVDDLRIIRPITASGRRLEGRIPRWLPRSEADADGGDETKS
jgi:hypothetical protein